MEPIYVFLIHNDVWIYILCGLGLFWYANEFWRSRRILRRAVFGLERETGKRIRNNALGFIFLFSAIIGIVYYVNDQIYPTLPPQLLKPPTPTPNIFATPLSSPTPLGTPDIVQSSPTAPLVPTITLSSQDSNSASDVAITGTPSTPATDAESAADEPVSTPVVGCTVSLNISEPRNGAVVAGSVSFSGTAATENFQFYKLEANGPETNGEWASLLGRTIDEPVRDGFLGSANLSLWSSGPYLIRLTAVDATFNETGHCVIQITLNNP